jgi:aminopeptidase N
VIRMMHTILGEEGFQAGMKCYFERHDGQAVTCDDFVNAMQDASGKDLTLFRRWYSQAGTPVVTVKDSFNADKGEYHLTVSQQVMSQGVKGQTLHIPFSVELLDSAGRSIVNKVLDVTKASQTFVFDGLDNAPVASLLQDFSAPVKLVYDFSIDHLVHLMRYASSEVARWEASVQLVSQTIWNNVAQLQKQQVMMVDTRVIEAFRGVILDANIDQALVAEILSIPSASALIEQVDNVDLDALAKAREFVVEELASACEDELLVRYRELLLVDNAGARAFKNIALSLLCQVTDTHESLVEKQYYSASNMTDSLGALKAAATAKLTCLPMLLSDFESTWQSTPLVMDKWLTLQALVNSDEVIEQIKTLTKHPSFSFSNPNRIRSLIGAFVAANTYQFHRADGEGYRYLTKILVKLNKTNPQVASRMITPLIQFAKFDQQRQQLMKQCLVELKSLPDLSTDLYEKVTKSLVE